MAKRKKAIEIVEKTTDVATQEVTKIPTTTHVIIRAGLNHKVGDVVYLGAKGVKFYKFNNLIK